MSEHKKATDTPRHPEHKWGPFHGGVSLAVWLNRVETEEGPRFFRSIQINPRRYRDKKTGNWEDAASLRPTDLPSLILAMEAAVAYCHNTPLPGQPVDEDQVEDAAVLDNNQPPF